VSGYGTGFLAVGVASWDLCVLVLLAGLVLSVGGAAQVTGQRPLSPVVFAAGGASRSCARRNRGNPQGKQRMDCGRK